MQLDFMQDSPGDLCGWFAGTELFRAAETFDEKAAQARKVTVADLKRVALQYLTPQALVTVAVGPFSARAPLQGAHRQAARWLR